MSVKLSGYVFRRIRGRIVPIRKGLEVASKSVSAVADDLLRVPEIHLSSRASAKFKSYMKSLNLKIDKVGQGVDFNVFKGSNSDFVLKIPKDGKGTASKTFAKAYPETTDKLAISKTLAENLPNYGIPTVQTDIVRISKHKRVLMQPLESTAMARNKNSIMKYIYSNDYITREVGKISREHGLELDAHLGNLTKQGAMLDTGASLAKSKISIFKKSDLAKELLGVENHWGAQLKDYFKKANILTESAAVEGASPSVLRKLNGLKKKGYRLKSSGDDVFKLMSPDDRIAAASAKGVTFKKVNGRMVPIRPKK